MLCVAAVKAAGFIHPAMGLSLAVPVVSVKDDEGPGAKWERACLAMSSGAKWRTWFNLWMFSNVTSESGVVDSLSPAVKTMWSSVPSLENSDLMLASRSGEARSQAWPVRRDLAEG